MMGLRFVPRIANDINDENQLSHMALEAGALLKVKKMEVIADTGYYKAIEIKKCVDKKLKVYIKKAKGNNRTKENEFRKEKFIYDSAKDIYICPMGNDLPFFESTSKKGLKYRRYKCSECSSCLKKHLCTTSKTGRNIQRWEHEEILEKVKEETLKHNDIYKQRRSIVEHPFGTIKRCLGYIYFLRRKMENVDEEAASMFIAYNFKRLFNMLSVKELIEKIEIG